MLMSLPLLLLSALPITACSCNPLRYLVLCTLSTVAFYAAYTLEVFSIIATKVTPVSETTCCLQCASPLHGCDQDQVRLLEREKAKMEDRRREGVQLFRLWKDHLLADADHSKTIPAFISHCLLPRCVLTPDDAMYCAASYAA